METAYKCSSQCLTFGQTNYRWRSLTLFPLFLVWSESKIEGSDREPILARHDSSIITTVTEKMERKHFVVWGANINSRVSIFQNICGKMFLSAARTEGRCDRNRSQSQTSQICLIPLSTLVVWLSECLQHMWGNELRGYLVYFCYEVYTITGRSKNRFSALKSGLSLFRTFFTQRNSKYHSNIPSHLLLFQIRRN